MNIHIPKDLDRFINGEISWEEIQDLYDGQPVKWLIVASFTEASYYSQDEHDLFEQLCYANILRITDLHKREGWQDYEKLYADYLLAKDISSTHKMNWDTLLEKIIKETNMSELDMDIGENILYKTYQETGSWPNDDDDYD